MFAVVVSSRAKRSLKKYRRNGTLPVEKYDKAIDHLRAGESLPVSYRDHTLHSNLAVYREFHLGYDLLVQYKCNENLRVVTITSVGTHDELFGS